MGKSLVRHEDPMREISIVSHNELMQAVSKFGGYTDSTGEAATSEKGLMVSINKRVKVHFGMAREEMPRDMLLHVASLYDRIIAMIDRGMRDGKTRREIKQAIGSTIKASAESYKTLTETAHASYH
jgi:hypothetical protein